MPPWKLRSIGDEAFFSDSEIIGVQSDCFGFTITNAGRPVIVVDACTNLASAVWLPVSTNTLDGGQSYFSDPVWANYMGRFYRFRFPGRGV